MFTGDYSFFDYKYNISGYTGQDFGGVAQHLYLGLSALFLVILLPVLRNASREKVLRIVRFTGVFLTLFYLGKTVWETVYDIRFSGGFNTGLLPLDTCSIVMPAALLAGFGRGRVRQTAICWLSTGGIVGGIGAMVRLNAFNYYPFLSFGAFYSMLWHLLMVFLGLLLAVTDNCETAGRTLRQGYAFHLFFSLLVIPVDFLFDFDFMLYRDLGGIPFFEGVAGHLTASGLRFLNPLLMLILYAFGFLLAVFIGQGVKRLFPRRKAGAEP